MAHRDPQSRVGFGNALDLALSTFPNDCPNEYDPHAVRMFGLGALRIRASA